MGLGAGDKLLFGSGAHSNEDSFTVIADDRLGKSMIVSAPDSPARVQLDESLFDAGTVYAHHFGSVSLYWTDTDHYLVALQTELSEHHEDLVASWEDSTFDLNVGGDRDQLANGLAAFASWSTNLDDALLNEVLTIDMPFGDLNLATYVGFDASVDYFAPKIEQLRQAVIAYSVTAPATPTVDDFVNHLDNYSNDFSVTRNCNGVHGYSVEMDIATFEQAIDLDLGSWSFDDLGVDLPFDLGLSVESDSDIGISGAITLSFDFGLDSDPDGDGNSFYVSDPNVGAELSMGDDAYDVATNVDPTTGERTLAWDDSTGVIHFEGDAHDWFSVGDTISIPNADGDPVSLVVASIGSFDAPTDRTPVTVRNVVDNALGGFDTSVFSAAARKTFDVDVNVGIFGLRVNDGFIDFDAGVDITLDSYLDSTALGAGTLPEFDVDLGGDFEYAVYLPVELSGALGGLNDHQAIISAFSSELPGDVGLNELIFSIPQSLRFDGFNELLQMRGISLDMILDALQATLDELIDGPLDSEIPLAGISANELLGGGAVGFAQELNAAISTVRASATNLDELAAQLNAEIRTAIPGLPADAQLLSMRYEDSAFEFDFDLTFFEHDTYDLDIGVEDLGLDDWLGFDISTLLNLDVDATLGVTATANVGLGFGFDLSDISSPVFYVDPTSGLSAEVIGTADDLNFNLGFDIGAGGIIGDTLGLVAAEGTALVDLGFYANLDDPAADANGNGYLDATEVPDAFQAEAYGNATLDVPLYFPIRLLPLGGTEEDFDGNGIPDNVLHADVGFTVNESLELETHYETQLPEFQFTFDAATALIGLLNDPAVVLAGLEGFFTGIDKTAQGIDNIDLPLIGGAPFDDLADELRDLRGYVLGSQESPASALKPNGDTYNFSYDGQTTDAEFSQSLGFWLENLDRLDEGVFDRILARIREELYAALSPINEGDHADKFGFLVPVLDEFGAEQYDDNGKLITKFPESADDIELTLSPQGLIQFNIKFGGTLVDGEIPIEFSAGVPGLNLDVDSTIQTEIDYLMGIGLGLGNMATDGTVDVGVFLDTSGINAAGEEIALDIDATLTPGSTAEGTLGFLKMSLEDVHETGSGLHGHLGLDIVDAGGDYGTANDGRLEPFEDVALELHASAWADVDIFAQVDASAAEFLPMVHTTIRYDQVLGDISLSTAGGGLQIDIGVPQVVLEDVTLDLGSLFESFLGDTFETISDIILPMKPVVDLLLFEMDLGIAKIKFIDMAYLRLPASVVDNAKKVLEVIQTTLEFLETVDQLSSGVINFGTYNLTEIVLESDQPAGSDDAAGGNAAGTEHSALLDGPDQKGHKAGKKQRTGRAWSIPILEEPTQLLNFVLGKGDPTLFWYDLPDLELDFVYRKSYPIFTGLNGVLYGGIGAYTNFDFGFDTRGLKQWQETGFDPAESWRIFNGFFLDDHGIENTASDLDEVVLQAVIAAGASLGIGGLVEAGVVGGIEATIGFDLNDKETDFSSADLPIGDAKLYGSELVERITQGPQCLFDVHGELRLFLEAFLWIGLDVGFSKITLFEASERFVDILLAEFDWECTLHAPEHIATRTDPNGTPNPNGNTLTVAYSGSNAGGPHNYNIDVLPVDDNLLLRTFAEEGYLDTEYYDRTEEVNLRDRLAGFRRDHMGAEVIVLSTGQRAEAYLVSDIDNMVINGTTGLDRYSLKKLNGRVNSITVTGNSGNDNIMITGDINNPGTLSTLIVNAGVGDDYVVVDSNMLGPAGTYTLTGDTGHDRLKLTGDNTNYAPVTINAGSGDDIVMGGDGPETILGEAGFDVILAAGGADTIHGGDEPSSVIAIYTDDKGQQQASPIYRPDGLPFDNGNAAQPNYNSDGLPVDASGTPINLVDGNHMVRSFSGDIIDGGDGDDTITSGQGFDEISGGAGNNNINSGAHPDVIDAGTGAATIDSGGGNDLIRWDYAPLNGQSISVVGGSGTEDTLEITIDDNSNQIDIDSNGTTAEVTIDVDDLLSLNGIEHLKLDTQQEADTIDIQDLLNTDLKTVDVQLGSRKATEWSADRDINGDYQVYSTSYEGYDGNAAARPSDYFYRYDLEEGGSYLFNADGSPQILPISVPAVVEGAPTDNSVQTIVVPDGLDRINLYYGYDSDAPDAGRTAGNSVEFSYLDALEVPPEGPAPADETEAEREVRLLAEFRASVAAAMETSLEQIPAIGDVTVTGIGTLADPFIVNVVSADTTFGTTDFKLIAQHHNVQRFSGQLLSRTETRVFERFYRIDDIDATYEFDGTGQPVLETQTQAATLNEGNQIQQLWLNELEPTAILWYGNNGIRVNRPTEGTDPVAALQTSLDLLLGANTSEVRGGGTAACSSARAARSSPAGVVRRISGASTLNRSSRSSSKTTLARSPSEASSIRPIGVSIT